MLLGVYWYFGFPDGLYAYEYFKFNRGFGGHADNPAELIAHVHCTEAEWLVDQLEKLVASHAFTYLQYRKSDSAIEISTGGYKLYDFDFHAISKVEELLKRCNARVNPQPNYNNAAHQQIIGNKLVQHSYPKCKFIQLVGSELKKSNAETLSIRIDCHMFVENRTGFINSLRDLLVPCAIDVFYYHESGNGSTVNLMLFITNGRQGVNSEPPKIVDIPKLESEIEALFRKFNVYPGHDREVSYPADQPIEIVLMKDQEFILGVET